MLAELGLFASEGFIIRNWTAQKVQHEPEDADQHTNQPGRSSTAVVG